MCMQHAFSGSLKKTSAVEKLAAAADDTDEMDFHSTLRKSSTPTKDRSDAGEVAKLEAEQKDFRFLLTKSGSPTKDCSDAGKATKQKADQQDFRNILGKSSSPAVSKTMPYKAEQKDFREVLKPSKAPKTQSAIPQDSESKESSSMGDISPRTSTTDGNRSLSSDDLSSSLSESSVVEAKVVPPRERRASQQPRNFSEADLHELQVPLFLYFLLFYP